jgi:hypothetical protein
MDQRRALVTTIVLSLLFVLGVMEIDRRLAACCPDLYAFLVNLPKGIL